MNANGSRILFREESYAILAACFEVHNELTSAYTEPVYQEALEMELSARGIPFVAQPSLPLSYKGMQLKHRFQPDFICHGSIVLEIKAVDALRDEHRAQVLNYLAATGKELGLLVNFGTFPKLQSERLANSRNILIREDSRYSRAVL